VFFILAEMSGEYPPHLPPLRVAERQHFLKDTAMIYAMIFSFCCALATICCCFATILDGNIKNNNYNYENY
jgi:H+/gluconate symporter-like permease